MDYSSHTYSGPPTEIDDTKKRWLVIGICLHSILSPALRKYVEPVVTNFYNSLRISDQIDKQNFKGHLKSYGAVDIKYLNYKAINNNKNTFGNRTPHYDYKVQNAVDLAKLFLEINMARYKGFDESCDASALLGLIVNIDKFPGNVQSAAEYVRSEIRNRWSHCNFTEWNSGMYNKSLQKIEDFINLLPLNATEKSQTIGELNKWKTNGTSYLKDTTLGLELVNDIRHQIQLLVEVEKVIYKSADTEFSTVYTELIKIGKTLSLHDTRISSLENKIAIHETKLLKCKSSYDAEPLINTWNQKMKHFVKTDVVNDILDLLKVCHCVLLTGVSGMGKTLTAQNIALHLCHEQKYSIVPCSNLNDIEMRYTDAYNQVFFIDDICGRFTTNRQKIEDWMRLDEFFKPILRKGMTKILATCRTEVFFEEIFQATFELFNKSSYNLSEKYSFKDKLVIAGKYLNQDEEMLAATLRNVDFTPLMCYLCAKHEHFDINDFLNSPYDTFCKEWNRLKYLDKEKYCVLFLCVLYNGKIDEYIVDISKELDKDELRKLGDIFECCNLGRDTSRSAIKDKLNACIDTYFIKVDKEYTIIHDKMFDFLCCYFGKALITQILKFADDKLICERVQLESIKKPNSEFTIIISINDESKYIERLKKDVENGKIHWCLNNVQMRYKEYREKLLDLLKSLDYDLKKRLINIKDVTGINSYITSCLRGYEELVIFFVSEGADVDARNGWFTPLTAACRDGHLKTVEILLNKGSHINKTNVDGETPLYTACFGGHYALVELLIDRSADIYKRNNTNHSSLYVSCLSGHDNIARLLITSGVNVFECSDSLIGATCGGSVKIVETLLTKEIDVNVVDMQGRTALLIACEEGYTNIVKLLIDKKADINKVDKIGSTPLHAACYAGFNDLVQILINNLADVNMLDKYRETPLHKSCRKGYVYVIQTLLANGADTNKANRDGYTPGDLAETEGKLADINMLKILETVPLGKLERINISESHDGKFKRQSVEAEQYEWTPLYKACDRGDVETVKTLLLNRADVNMKTKNGELSLVAACQQGHGILIQMLLDKGADINQSLLTAVQRDYERTVNILLCKRGCFGDYVNTLMTLACKAGSIKTIRILLEKGADINHVDNNKNIPICTACTKGFFHIVELLIKRGSKLNYRCKDGKTPLYYACELGFQTIAEILIVNGADVNEIYADRKALQHNNDLFHLLTEKGLVSNIPDKDGRYPLFLSIDTGFYLISEYLVQKDYHIAMLEDDRKTALISVFQSGKKELAYLLLSKGYTTNLTNFNATILYYACKLGLSEKVRTHENKTDLKRVYKDGYTLFLLADIAGNDDLSAYLREQCNYTFISNKTYEIVNRRSYCDSRYLDLGDKRYEYLFQACMNGHTEALIKKTVLSKLNINIFFGPRGRNDGIWFEQTPLCLAIRRGHTKVIELLLKHGANVNLTFENKVVVRTENFSPTIEYGYTPLFAAFQRKFDKITNILLDSGADLEQTLYDACREGYIDAVLFLIKKGADVNSCVRYCQTALYAACLGGFHTIVKFLIERGANINQLGDKKNNSTCLHAACLAGNHKVVQLLVDSGASVDAVTNRYCLHTACVVGNNKIIEILIENGVDINASQLDGKTPLMVYVLKNKMDFPSEKSVCLSQLELKYNDLTDSQYKVIQQLIKNGANIQLKDVFGRTPLSVAKETKDEKLIELLLGKEIDIDMKTNSGETLTSEAQFENNHDKILYSRLY